MQENKSSRDTTVDDALYRHNISYVPRKIYFNVTVNLLQHKYILVYNSHSHDVSLISSYINAVRPHQWISTYANILVGVTFKLIYLIRFALRLTVHFANSKLHFVHWFEKWFYQNPDLDNARQKKYLNYLYHCYAPIKNNQNVIIHHIIKFTFIVA